MAKYIEKERLIDFFKDTYGGGNEGNTCVWYQDIIRNIDEAPNADVAPVVHGKWEHTHTSKSYFNECWRCSVCGLEDTEGFEFVFCPNCGAKMDLED